jgi:hypothetical protein
VIHPRTDLAAVVRHAHENAAFLCEQCYLTSPGTQKLREKETVEHVEGEQLGSWFLVRK